MPEMLVTKASGELQRFNSDKLRLSLVRAGASKDLIGQIVREVEDSLYSGIPTADVYKLAFSILKGEHLGCAAKFSLKRALSQLGPSGFPFERIVAAAFETKGFKCETDLMLEGKCVRHEVDLRAASSKMVFLAECKYRNQPGAKVDLKTALYVYARSLDLKTSLKNGKFQEFWLITNTRFSEDAIQYAECVGLKLLSWDYPEKSSLKKLLDESGIHPVTSLTSLNLKQKQALLDLNIVTIKQLSANRSVIKQLRLKRNQALKLNTELEYLERI